MNGKIMPERHLCPPTPCIIPIILPRLFHPLFREPSQ